MAEFNELLDSIKKLNATEAERRELLRLASLERIRELREQWRRQRETN
jgi:hypothetical protein